METTKIAANIKASVLRLAVNSQWCERTLSWEQATTSYTRRPRHLDYQTYVKHRCIYIAHVAARYRTSCNAQIKTGLICVSF